MTELNKQKAQEQDLENASVSESTKKSDTNKEAKTILILGILGLLLSCFFIGVPLAFVAVIKGVKALKKDKNNTKALVGTICGGIVVIIFILSIVVGITSSMRDSSRKKELNSYIDNQQYEEAIQLLESYNFGKKNEFEAYSAIYEATGNYDEMVDLIISYYDSDDKTKLVDNSADAIEKLDIIYEKVSDDNKTVINAYKSKIDTIKNDLALETQKAESEAKKAEAEAEKAEAEVAAKKAEADKAEAEAAAKKAEADKAASEAELKKAEADKAATEATSKQTATEKSKSNNTKTVADQATTTSKKETKYDTYRKQLMDWGFEGADTLDDNTAESYYTYANDIVKEASIDISAMRNAISSRKAFFGLTDSEINSLSDYDIISYYADILYGEEIYEDDEIISNSDMDNAPFVTYKELLRNPGRFEGSYIKFYARVGSVFNESKNVYSAYIGEYKTTYGTTYFATEGDAILVQNTSDTRWLDNDIVYVYGLYQGEIKYNTRYSFTGAENVENIPTVKLVYSELVEE